MVVVAMRVTEMIMKGPRESFLGWTKDWQRAVRNDKARLASNLTHEPAAILLCPKHTFACV